MMVAAAYGGGTLLIACILYALAYYLNNLDWKMTLSIMLASMASVMFTITAIYAVLYFT